MFDVLNIACGGHAGDAASMERVIRWCAASRCAIGAHPSYPDRAGLRPPHAGDRARGARGHGHRAVRGARGDRSAQHARAVEYVKPHGALYHDAAAERRRSRTRWSARSTDVLGDRGRRDRAAGRRAARRRGRARPALRERGLRRSPDARRRQPRAAQRARRAARPIPPQAAAQARVLAARVDTICVHADTPGALAIAGAVHRGAAWLTGRRSAIARSGSPARTARRARSCTRCARGRAWSTSSSRATTSPRTSTARRR